MVDMAYKLVEPINGVPAQAITNIAHAIMGNTIVFDTEENGIRYRNRLIEAKKYTPKIITLDEKVIRSDGGYVSFGTKLSLCLPQVCFH